MDDLRWTIIQALRTWTVEEHQPTIISEVVSTQATGPAFYITNAVPSKFPPTIRDLTQLTFCLLVYATQDVLGVDVRKNRFGTTFHRRYDYGDPATIDQVRMSITNGVYWLQEVIDASNR